MLMIRVSIIIPAYNAARLIDRSLESALRQTYPAIEYVVVDDCSTDDTAERVERLRQASDRRDAVKLVRHERNRGVAAARNSGLHAATGDYIYFLDSDDELPPDAIATLVALVDETSPVDLVLGEVEVTGVARSRIAHIDMQEGRVDGQKAILAAFLAGRWPDMTCNKLERRAFLERHRMAFVEGIVHEDALWGFELAMNADSMVVSRKVTYIYHLQEVSITRGKSDRNFTSLLTVLDRIVSHVAERGLQTSQPALWDYLADFRIYYYKELVRAKMPVAYIQEKIQAIRVIMRRMPKFRYRKRLASRLKDMAYALPMRLGIVYVKLLVALSK